MQRRGEEEQQRMLRSDRCMRSLYSPGLSSILKSHTPVTFLLAGSSEWVQSWITWRHD